MGYRYLLFTLGGFTLLLWGLRFFLFTLEESPRFLVGLGKDAEAVAVIQRIATFNGKECSLTVDDLQRAESEVVGDVKAGDGKRRSVLSASSDYTIGHVKALFKTKKLAWSTSLLIAIWGGFYFLLSFTALTRKQVSSASHQHYTTTFYHSS